MFSFENKSVESPSRFLSDKVEFRAKNLFHGGFFANGTFGIRYRTQQLGTIFTVGHLRICKNNAAKSMTRTDLGISTPKILSSNVDVSANFKLDKPARFNVHVDIRKIFDVVSLSTTLMAEKGVLKEIQLCPTFEDADKKIRVQLNKSFNMKHDDKKKPLLILLKNTSSFKNFGIYKAGIEILNEEKVTNLREYTGTNVIKFNLKSPDYFGIVTSHKFTLKTLMPRIENLVLFYRTPQSIVTLGYTETHKQTKNYHFSAVTSFDKHTEVGIKFDTDDTHKKNHLQLGLSYTKDQTHFKVKVNDALRAMFFYSYKINNSLRMSLCCNATLLDSTINLNPAEDLFPFGLKFEVRG